MNTAQAGQDEFVNQLLVIPENLRAGKFLDVGCGHPVEISNTWELEQLGWRGLLVDSNPGIIAAVKNKRKSAAVCADATTIQYPEQFRKVDYLSLDVDEAEVATLQNLLNQNVRFRAATVEHASYLYGNAPRDELRRLLNAAGYLCICRDVCNGGVVYEDWWIDPKRVPLMVAARFVSAGLDGPEIAKRGTNKFCGFNGQIHRQTAVAYLLSDLKIEGIIETGTCNGETAGYLEEISGSGVFTIEVDSNWHSVACERLKETRIAKETGSSPSFAAFGDSRTVLKEAFTDVAKNWRTLFYLDAHWGAELPLAEEIDIIAGGWKEFVIVIDDFRVPDDAGYGFDDYGGTKVIGPELIADVVKKHDLAVFYPATHSSVETGAKRGTAYLCRRGPTETILAMNPLLRRSA